MGLKRYQLGTQVYLAHNRRKLWARLYGKTKFNAIKAESMVKLPWIPMYEYDKEDKSIRAINRDLFTPSKKNGIRIH